MTNNASYIALFALVVGYVMPIARAGVDIRNVTFEPLAASSVMYSREISDPGLMTLDTEASAQAAVCRLVAEWQRRVVPRIGQPSALTHSIAGTWGAGDPQGDYVASTIAFVVVIHPETFSIVKFKSTMTSLLGTPENRLCKVFVVCTSRGIVSKIRDHVEGLANDRKSGLLFTNVEVIGEDRNTPDNWNVDADNLQKYIRKYTQIPYLVVLPHLVTLQYTFRGYQFVVAFKGDQRGMLEWMGPVMRPLEQLDSQAVGYILGEPFPNGKVLPIGGWGEEPGEPTGIARAHVVPRHSRWFLKEYHLLPDIKEGCKLYIYATNMCRVRKHQYGSYRSYIWGCDEVNPLMHFNEKAYYQGDPVTQYVAENLTIVITDHLVPSAPSTLLIRMLYWSVQMMPELRKARIVMLYDGPKPAEDLSQAQHIEAMRRKHVANIKELIAKDPLFAQTELVVLKKQGHLYGQMKLMLELVKTKFVLVLQPDLPFARPGEVYSLLRTMQENEYVRHVRFNRRSNIPFWFDEGMDDQVPNNKAYVPLSRTWGWSSMNHMSTLEYYDGLLQIAEAGIKSGMTPDRPPDYYNVTLKRLPTMENVLHPHILESYKRVSNDEEAFYKEHLRWGTYVYGYPGEPNYIVHVDGSETHGPTPPKYFEAMN